MSRLFTITMPAIFAFSGEQSCICPFFAATFVTTETEQFNS
jgi:hypothetical protein